MNPKKSECRKHSIGCQTTEKVPLHKSDWTKCHQTKLTPTKCFRLNRHPQALNQIATDCWTTKKNISFQNTLGQNTIREKVFVYNVIGQNSFRNKLHATKWT